MKMHEILKALETPSNEISFDVIAPYRKSLRTYFSNQFGGTPIFMVTMLTNAWCYGRIEPENELHDAAYSIVELSNDEGNDSFDEQEEYVELVLSQSFVL